MDKLQKIRFEVRTTIKNPKKELMIDSHLSLRIQELIMDTRKDFLTAPDFAVQEEEGFFKFPIV
jgi:hypothetical protein